MKLPPALHRWAVGPARARAIQEALAGRVQRAKLATAPRIVAGADMAFLPDGKTCVAGIVVWSVEARTIVETVVARRRVGFPYVPGLLSFREAPAVLAAIRKLKTTPDAFLFDGQGVAHPRRFGLACHIGLWMDSVSIGCAKSRLCGEHGALPASRGASVPLTDRGETIGAVVRTRDGVSPVYVSVGHRIDLPGAIAVVLACCMRFRIPEPTRLAHHLVTRAAGRGSMA